MNVRWRSSQVNNSVADARPASAVAPAQRTTAGTSVALQRLLYALAIVGVVVVAITVRVAFWRLQATSGAVQPGDPEEYYRAAVHILQGGYDDTGKWLRPPLYPAFLAATFAVGGIDVSFALFCQALLTGVGVAAFVVLGTALFWRRTVGLLSGLIAALFVPLASFGSVLFAEGLFVVLVVLGLTLLLWASDSRRWWVALLCGVVLGLATLTRATALFFVPVAALLVLWMGSREQGTGTGRTKDQAPRTTRHPSTPSTGSEYAARSRSLSLSKGTHLLLLPVLVVVGAVLVIAPWTLRNYLVHDRLIVVDTNGGISMWYGMVQGDADRAAGEARIFSEPNLADRQRVALELTLERITDDPGLFLSRMRYKLASLFLLQSRSYATGEVVTISPQGEQIALSAGENPPLLSVVADVQYVLVMLAGIVGLCFASAWRRAVPLMAWFALGVLLSIITVAHHRLRLPLVAVFIPFSAYALLGLPAAFRHGRRLLRNPRTLLALAGCLVFCGLIFSTRYLTWLGGEHYALLARNAEDLTTAQRNLEQAQAADPTNALRTLALGDLAFEQRDFAEATTRYQAAAALEPRSLYAYAMQIWTGQLLDRPAQAAAAIATIDSYGRNNNDLYQWAWEHRRVYNEHAQVVPGDPLAFGDFAGFAPPTPDFAAGRWTLGHGRVRVAGGCGTLNLLLNGPTGRTATVWIEDWGIRQQVMLNGTAQTISLPLDSIRECEFAPPLVVHIESATGLLDLERAPWGVGVAVQKVWTE